VQRGILISVTRRSFPHAPKTMRPETAATASAPAQVAHAPRLSFFPTLGCPTRLET
jgi:hypothetical protein